MTAGIVAVFPDRSFHPLLAEVLCIWLLEHEVQHCTLAMDRATTLRLCEPFAETGIPYRLVIPLSIQTLLKNKILNSQEEHIRNRSAVPMLALPDIDFVSEASSLLADTCDVLIVPEAFLLPLSTRWRAPIISLESLLHKTLQPQNKL